MSNKAKKIRRAQTLAPFGVGAILDIEGESLIAADITRWKSEGEEIHEPRLEKKLGVKKFKMAPAGSDFIWQQDKSKGIPYFRFPQWLFCPKSTCRRMTQWKMSFEDDGSPICNKCPEKPKLIPMRFVMACPRGHLDDIPWVFWAHFQKPKCEDPQLQFLTLPGGSGLEFLSIKCMKCGAQRTLEGLANPGSLGVLNIHCNGRQPWEAKNNFHPCDAIPQVLQRGATNLTFANIESSIDIPPYSNFSSYSEERLNVTSTSEFSIIKENPDGPIVDHLIKLIANKLKIEVKKVKQIVLDELNELEKPAAIAAKDTKTLDLLPEEYAAFIAPDPDEEPDLRDRFIKRHVDLDSYISERPDGDYGLSVNWIGRHLSNLVQITKLREVRTLTGFSRLSPAFGEIETGEGPSTFPLYGSNKRIAPLPVSVDLNKLNHSDRWFPAIEVYGEGIFFSLEEDILQNWENRKEVRDRIKILKDRFAKGGSFLKSEPTARLILLHTLSHLLIRQLSFECGYSLASLRERIYAKEPPDERPMAGILIYTAAGDSEGTLGGLVREGKADRFLSTIMKALQNAEWCSSDPLCRESTGQGLGAMNLAACYACSLLPETSCIISNRLLDRLLLFGTSKNPTLGFFSELVEQIVQTMGSERW